MISQKIVDIVEKLQNASRSIPKIWDGRSAILEMRDGGSTQWRQMEWMGFYFEFLCETHFDGIIDIPGKKYGNTEFDAFREISWDFKSHAANTTNHTVITNDVEAIKNTLNDYEYYGIILAIGEVEYNDEKRTFKQWHDQMKESEVPSCRTDLQLSANTYSGNWKVMVLNTSLASPAIMSSDSTTSLSKVQSSRSA